MAISAKQLQVSFVGRPVFKSSSPYVLSILWANLFRWVNVIYIEGAKVGEAAFNALPAKIKYKSHFTLPIARALMDAMSVFVPKVFHTKLRTKSGFAFCAAIFACSMFVPSVREIARLPTKLGALMLCDRFSAMFASIHACIIPKYFDIACERIENAQRQGRLIA